VAGPGRKNVDEALVLALAAGGSVPAAARHAGCSARTAYRRLAEDGFKARVEAARADLVQRAVGKLSALGGLAADTLQALLSAEAETVRLGAARAVLENMFKGVEIDNVLTRLARLEAGGGDAAGGPGAAAGAGDEQGGGGAVPGPGPAAGRPDDSAAGGGPDARPVAAEGATVTGEADVVPLWTAKR
jgi:hypothetical protein